MGDGSQQVGPQSLLTGLCLRPLLFPHGQLLFQRQTALVQQGHHQVFLKGLQRMAAFHGDAHHRQSAPGTPDGEIQALGARQGVGGRSGVLVIFQDPLRHRLLIRCQ